MIKRMDHVGFNVHDLPAARDFFVALGMTVLGEMSMEGELVERIVALDGVKTDIAMLATPDGHNRIELVKWNAPVSAAAVTDEPANTPGLSHLCFNVDDLDATLEAVRPHGGELLGEIQQYEHMYKLCYLRGPEGVILELAEDIGGA
jgi:catechol 2,3-dioxygenase-like lactoylglutathione lyase family enzyme